MAQGWLALSVPAVAVLAGLLDSEPVVWAGLEPSGDFSGLEAGVLGVLGLLLEPEDAGAEGLLLGKADPGVDDEVPDEVEVGAVSRPAPVEVLEPPPAKPCPGVLEPRPPEPATPESLPLELPVPEPTTPVSLPLELLFPEPARPLSLPLEPLLPEFEIPESLPPELPVPEPARPVSLPLELPVPEPARPASLPLELPEPEFAKPLPALELDVVPAVWLGRELWAVEAGLVGVPEGLVSRLEVGVWLLERPPEAPCEVGRLSEVGALASRPEAAVLPPAKPLVSGVKLVLARALEALRLPVSPGCAALERTLASRKGSTPEALTIEERANAESPLLELAPPAAELNWFEALVLLTPERNKFGLTVLGLRFGRDESCWAGFGASKGERCLRVMV